MPKCKNYKYDNVTLKVHFAYYKDKLIAASEDKSLLKDYMEKHRRLNPMQYKIESSLLDGAHFFNKYENIILTPYYNLCIPNIDIKIIEMEYGNLKSTLIDSLLSKLKYFTFLVNNTTSEEKDVESLVNTIRITESYCKKPKKYSKIEKAHLLSHPVLSCGIDEYFNFIKIVNEYSELMSRYKYMCEKD